MTTPKNGCPSPNEIILNPMNILMNSRARYFRDNMINYNSGTGKYQEIYNKLLKTNYMPFIWLYNIYNAWYRENYTIHSKEDILSSGKNSNVDSIIENFSDTVSENLHICSEKYYMACSCIKANFIEMALNNDKNCILCIEIIEAVNGVQCTLEFFIDTLLKRIQIFVNDINEENEAKNNANNVRETLRLRLDNIRKNIEDDYSDGSTVRFVRSRASSPTDKTPEASPINSEIKGNYGRDIGNYISTRKRDSIFGLFKRNKKGSLTS